MAQINAQQLEQAVLCLSDPSRAGPQVTGQALAFCSQVKLHPQAWAAYMQLLAGTSHKAVRFWALGAMQEFVASAVWSRVPPAEREKLRAAVLRWCQQRLAESAAMSQHLRNKAAVVLAVLLKREFPERWGSAFGDLGALLGLGLEGIQLWLRIVYYIDEEIVRFDVRRSKVRALCWH